MTICTLQLHGFRPVWAIGGLGKTTLAQNGSQISKNYSLKKYPSMHIFVTRSGKQSTRSEGPQYPTKEEPKVLVSTEFRFRFESLSLTLDIALSSASSMCGRRKGAVSACNKRHGTKHGGWWEFGFLIVRISSSGKG